MDHIEQDEELVLQMKESDMEAYGLLYIRYRQAIYHFVLKYVRSIQLSEDITQEIFIKVWDNREKLNNVRTFKSYLFTIAKNHTLNRLKQSFYAEKSVDQFLTYFPVISNQTLDDFQLKEYTIFISKVLDSLPTRTSEIFRLCREEGKSYEEAASIVGVSRNAIKNHMVTAMKRLSAAIERKLDITLSMLVFYFIAQQLFYIFTTLH